MNVDWEVVTKCNYTCKYCEIKDTIVKPVEDETVLRNFINMLSEKYSNTSIYIFGGEPFLHPKIKFILEYLYSLNQEFLVQTNCSNYSMNQMEKINIPINIAISIHPEMLSLKLLENQLKKINNFNSNINVNHIAVMYTGRSSLEYYLHVVKGLEKYNSPLSKKVYFHPISKHRPVDNEADRLDKLRDFIKLSENSAFTKVFKFEKADNGKLGCGAKLWEKMMSGEFIIKGKPCIYKNYILYGPDLKSYTCGYRKNPTDNICQYKVCPLAYGSIDTIYD